MKETLDMKETLEPKVVPSKVEAPAPANTKTDSLENDSLSKERGDTGTYAADPVEGSFDLGGGQKPEAQEAGPEAAAETAEAKESPQDELDSLSKQSQGYNRELETMDAKSKETGTPLTTSEFLSKAELEGRLMSTQMLSLQKEIEITKNDPNPDQTKITSLETRRRELASSMIEQNTKMQEEMMQRGAEAFFGEEQIALGDVQIGKLLEAWKSAEGRKESLNAILAEGSQELTESEAKAFEEIVNKPDSLETSVQETPASKSLNLLADQKTLVESWKGLSDNVEINYQLAMINFAMVVAQIAEKSENPAMKTMMQSVVANLTAMVAASIAREQKRIELEIKEKAKKETGEKKKETLGQLIGRKLRQWLALDSRPKAVGGIEKLDLSKVKLLGSESLISKMKPESVAGRLSDLFTKNAETAKTEPSNKTETARSGNAFEATIDLGKTPEKKS